MSVCKQHVECDARTCANNKDGECISLTECMSPQCPFFKTREQAAQEIAFCIERKTMLLRQKQKQ